MGALGTYTYYLISESKFKNNKDKLMGIYSGRITSLDNGTILASAYKSLPVTVATLHFHSGEVIDAQFVEEGDHALAKPDTQEIVRK